MAAEESSAPSVESGAAQSQALADGEALRELMHRVKDGMNNAAISLQPLESNLANEPVAAKDSAWVLTMALRGLTQAMRSHRIIAARTGVAVQAGDASIAPSMEDIAAMLSPVARRHNVRFEAELDADGAALAVDIAHASEILSTAIAAIQQAGRSARVSLRYSASPRRHYTLEVLPRAGTPATIEFFVGRRPPRT